MTTLTGGRSNDVILPVYCRGCRALIGYNRTDRQPSIYCTDPVCPHVPPVSATEERDGLIILLKQTGAYSKERLGTLVNLSRQRITQILST